MQLLDTSYDFFYFMWNSCFAPEIFNFLNFLIISSAPTVVTSWWVLAQVYVHLLHTVMDSILKKYFTRFPWLSHKARPFLIYQTTKNNQNPIVSLVFTVLKVCTELLENSKHHLEKNWQMPLYCQAFINYIFLYTRFSVRETVLGTSPCTWSCHVSISITFAFAVEIILN